VSVVVLYGRPGCCLCDEARSVLERVRARQPFELIEVDIERDPAAAEFVMSVNGGNQTVPTVLFPDGTALCNPSAAQVKAQLAASAG